MSIHVVAIGNVTRDPEVVETTNSSVTKFGIASNRYISKDKQTVTFLDVEAWANNGGEFAAKHFKKGSSVEIVGQLEQQNWENNEGEKRSKLVCKAISVGFGPMAPKKKDEDEGSSEETTQEAPAPKKVVKKTTAKPAAKTTTTKKPAPVLETETEEGSEGDPDFSDLENLLGDE